MVESSSSCGILLATLLASLGWKPRGAEDVTGDKGYSLTLVHKLSRQVLHHRIPWGGIPGGIEHYWPADSVAAAIQELRSLRELCSENGLFDDEDDEGGEKP